MPRRRTYITPIDEKAIGRRLRDIRQRRGLTQGELAQQLGIDQTLVSNYERGAARLHGALVAGFAKALRVSSDEILGLKQSVGPDPSLNARRLRRLQQLDLLPVTDQRAVLRFLEALLAQRRRDASGARAKA